ncbi:TRAP transporter small permease [Martelella sp. FOR1707]
MVRYLLVRASSLMFGVAAYVCYPAILVIISIDVVRRYVFNSPWTWSQEFASLMLFLALALSAPAAWLAGVHIRAEFVRANVSPKAKSRIERVVWLLLVLASVALAYQCWKDGRMMILFNENSPELDLPHVWFRFALGLSAIMTGLVGLWGLVTGHVADADSSEHEEIIE